MTDFAAARRAMVDCQVRPSDVTRYPIIDAMLTIRKEEFVPANKRAVAYAGEHIALAPGRVVLDARVIGKMLDAVEITRDDLVLDIGCGLGYVAALLGHMAEAVIAVEEDPELAEAAAKTLSDEDILNVVVEQGPLGQGAADHGPYDVIFVEGAVERLPETLTDQLKIGGRVVALFREGATGQCKLGVRTDSGVTWRRAFDATAPVLPGFEAEKAFEF